MASNRKVEFIEVLDQGLKEIGSGFKKLMVDMVVKFADVLGEDFGKSWEREKKRLIAKTQSKSEK